MERLELEQGNLENSDGDIYALGRYFTGGNEAYQIRATEISDSEIEVRFKEEEEGDIEGFNLSQEVYLHRGGDDRYISVSTEDPELPRGREELETKLEAYARFALQREEEVALTLWPIV